MTWICVSELNTWGADIQKCVIVTLIVSKPAIYTYTTLNRLTRGWFKSTVKPRQIWKLFLKRTALSRWATLGVISPNVHTYSLCVCVRVRLWICVCITFIMTSFQLQSDSFFCPIWSEVECHRLLLFPVNLKYLCGEFYQCITMILSKYNYYDCSSVYHYHITAIILMIWSIIWASVFSVCVNIQ